MEDIIDHTDEKLTLTDKEVFTQIWFSPRKVFRHIVDTDYDKYFTVLLVLSGIVSAFDRAERSDMGGSLPLMGVVIITVLLGALLGWISYYLYAALISWTGKWLGGEAGTLPILRILAYAMLPSIVAFVFLIPQIAVHGIELFKKEGHVAGGGWLSNVMMFSSLIIQTVLSIWTAVLAIVGISVVQNFSMGKAIVNAILPALVIGIPLVLFIFIVMSV